MAAVHPVISPSAIFVSPLSCRQLGGFRLASKSRALCLKSSRRRSSSLNFSSLQVAAAMEYLDGSGDASAANAPSLGVASAAFEASEGMSTSENYTAKEEVSTAAKGSVGVVEAMTGKTVEGNPDAVTDGGIGTGDGDFGGNGGGGGDGNGGSEPHGGKKTQVLSMSQKLTLVYAAIVGVGGLVGFLKSGSTKSLFSGGVAALALFNVYRQLPVNPVQASSIGVCVSLVLLYVMGSRFMASGKIFPAGVVSFVSFIMAGGYVHGIMRSRHS